MLLEKAERECVTLSPRSLSAIELAERIKLECSNHTPEEALELLLDQLDSLLRQVEQERRQQNSAIVAGAMISKLLPIYALTKQFDSAPEPLRSHLYDLISKGDSYEIHTINK